jgi:hypothetical protein
LILLFYHNHETVEQIQNEASDMSNEASDLSRFPNGSSLQSNEKDAGDIKKDMAMPRRHPISYKDIGAFTDNDSCYGLVDGLDNIASLFATRSSWTSWHNIDRIKVQTSSRIKVKFPRKENETTNNVIKMGTHLFKNINLFEVSIFECVFVINLTLFETTRRSYLSPYFTMHEIYIIVSLLNVTKDLTIDTMNAEMSQLMNELREGNEESFSDKYEDDEKMPPSNLMNENDTNDESFVNMESMEQSDGCCSVDNFMTSIKNKKGMDISVVRNIRNETDVITSYDWQKDHNTRKILQDLGCHTKESMVAEIASIITCIQGMHNFRACDGKKSENKSLKHDKSSLTSSAMRIFGHNFNRALKCIATRNKEFSETYNYWGPVYTTSTKAIERVEYEYFCVTILFQGKFMFTGKNFKHTMCQSGGTFLGSILPDVDNSTLERTFNEWYRKQTIKCHEVMRKCFSDDKVTSSVNFDIGLCIYSLNENSTMLLDLKEGMKQLRNFVQESQSGSCFDSNNEREHDDTIPSGDKSSDESDVSEWSDEDTIEQEDNEQTRDYLFNNDGNSLDEDEDRMNDEHDSNEILTKNDEHVENIHDMYDKAKSFFDFQEGSYRQLMYTENGNISLGAVTYNFELEDVFFKRSHSDGGYPYYLKVSKSILSTKVTPGQYSSGQGYCPQVKEISKAHEIKNLECIQTLPFHGLNLMLDNYSTVHKKDSINEMRGILSLINQFIDLRRETLSQSRMHIRLEMYTSLVDSITEDFNIPLMRFTDFLFQANDVNLLRRYMRVLFSNIDCIKKVFEPCFDMNDSSSYFEVFSCDCKTYILKCLEFTQIALCPIAHHGPLIKSMWKDIKELECYEVPTKYRRLLDDRRFYDTFGIPYGIDKFVLPLPKIDYIPSTTMNGLAKIHVEFSKTLNASFRVSHKCTKKKFLPFVFNSTCISQLKRLSKSQLGSSGLVSYVEASAFVKSIAVNVATVCKLLCV